MLLVLTVCAIASEPPHEFTVFAKEQLYVRVDQIQGFVTYPERPGLPCIKILMPGGLTMYVERTPELDQAIQER